MGALLMTAVLVCYVPMPLRDGQAAEDAEIAKMTIPVPEAMAQSMQERTPPAQSLQFVGEQLRREWVIAGNSVASDGSRQMLRITLGETGSWQLSAELGNAEQTADGTYRFSSVGKGGCKLEAAEAEQIQDSEQ